MCGIVGILGREPVAPMLVEALKRLEYRGYDSAGVATLEAGHLARCRAEGKLRNLESKLGKSPLSGVIGIGHTRWATHGAPNETNAHPHATERLALVHNGIIENFRELRDELSAEGRRIATETDSEIVAHLITHYLDKGMKPMPAVEAALARLKGAFALAILFEGEDDLLIAARRGSPLAIGHGDGVMYLGSDAIALAPFTDRITYLDDGDVAEVKRSGVVIHDASGKPVARRMTRAIASSFLVDKGNYRHFMAKEIAEQPEVVGHTLAHYLDLSAGRVAREPFAGIDFAHLDRVAISACGTAYYSGLVARYWFERFGRLPVDIDVASEFRYREVPLAKGGLAVFVSQSGETADTLASLRYAREAGQTIAAVVNVRESNIAREADVLLPTFAGPEIGVASTKAFTCQLSVLACLAVAAGRARGNLTDVDEQRLVRALVEVPRFISEVLRLEPQIEALARDIARARDVLYLGRGTSYPIALEGALKLKEISYIHAEGYAAGELKHGPIALIDKEMPVVVIAPYDKVFDKTASNLEEVASRGGRIIFITDEKGAKAVGNKAMTTLVMPEMPATIAPIVYAVPVQLLAYHTAVARGTDVDQPRNLAKSVTVE